MVASKWERGDRFIHGERLHVLIKELLEESSVDFDMLNGVCVGKGPGSYTGLRIGVSTAKGLCYAAGKPLYSVPTLGCFNFSNCTTPYVITVLDARRDEVYSQIWRSSEAGVIPEGPVEAVIISDESWKALQRESVTVVGEGANKIGQFMTKVPVDWQLQANTYPDAKYMGQHLINLPKAEDVAYFEPYYLKDFVAEKSQKKFF
jgi:tRNA threonylcarbamoyladenosine biosynthesis protein TsaB